MAVRNYIVNIPVVGGIAYCSWIDLWNALQEISIKFGIASFPVLISTLILRFVGLNHVFFPEALTNNFVNGELYLVCTSMLSAIFYIALKDRGDDKPGFPNKSAHLFFVLFMVGLSAVIFALKRAGLYIDPVLLVKTSYYFFGICFGMVILATTINNGLSGPNALKFQKDDTNDFFDKVKERRDAK